MDASVAAGGQRRSRTAMIYGGIAIAVVAAAVLAYFLYPTNFRRHAAHAVATARETTAALGKGVLTYDDFSKYSAGFRGIASGFSTMQQDDGEETTPPRALFQQRLSDFISKYDQLGTMGVGGRVVIGDAEMREIKGALADLEQAYPQAR